MQWIETKQKLNKSEWHLWFAWKPVPVFEYPDGSKKIVWLETVLRRLKWHVPKVYGIMPYQIPEYKERPAKNPYNSRNGFGYQPLAPVEGSDYHPPRLTPLQEEECPGDLQDTENMKKAFASLTWGKEPCSNCGGELDENYNCTNDGCPLSKPPYTKDDKHEIDIAWEVKNAKRNKTIV